VKLAAWLLAVFGVLFVLAALACWGAAIWVVGPDSQRLGGTGLLLILTGGVMTAVGSAGVVDNS
jgi:hypothetical protein